MIIEKNERKPPAPQFETPAMIKREARRPKLEARRQESGEKTRKGKGATVREQSPERAKFE
jgi:hypothetical protein